MSDQAQGPGWWQAADGRWYPPNPRPQQRSHDQATDPPSTVPSSAWSARMRGGFSDRTLEQKLLLVAAVAIAAGCFLPWVRVQFIGTITASGIDADDGWIFLGGAVLVGLLAWMGRPGKTLLILCALAAVGFVVEYDDIKNSPESDELAVSIGFGLWLILAASILGFVAAARMILDAND